MGAAPTTPQAHIIKAFLLLSSEKEVLAFLH
jgi:hypothetical protein